MKFLADENIDKPIVERLRQDGHSVLFVLEMAPGMSDEEVLAQANKEASILLTADKDFGELVFRQSRAVAGVILIRLAGLSPTKKAETVSWPFKLTRNGSRGTLSWWVRLPFVYARVVCLGKGLPGRSGSVGLSNATTYDCVVEEIGPCPNSPRRSGGCPMKYRVGVEQDEDGVFVAECPSLPGCISQGKTRAETLDNIRDAIRGYLESLKKHDEPVPPSIDEEIVEVVL